MRQREILQLIAEGQTTKDIAQRLNSSASKRLKHRSQLMSGLKFTTYRPRAFRDPRDWSNPTPGSSCLSPFVRTQLIS
ncbi:MAG: LuxR C-terminal-related transcriptional regulator [Nitrospira sp.]|nr:LuxR C-terminal-related transcriptional regulator [Nitrospira sp.]